MINGVIEQPRCGPGWVWGERRCHTHGSGWHSLCLDRSVVGNKEGGGGTDAGHEKHVLPLLRTRDAHSHPCTHMGGIFVVHSPLLFFPLYLGVKQMYWRGGIMPAGGHRQTAIVLPPEEGCPASTLRNQKDTVSSLSLVPLSRHPCHLEFAILPCIVFPFGYMYVLNISINRGGGGGAAATPNTPRKSK